MLSLIAVLGEFGAAFATWGSIVQVPFLGMISVAGFGCILGLVLFIVLAKSEKALRQADIAILILGLILLAAWAGSQLYLYPAYGTDEAAFEQYAGQLLMHGQNPYLHSMLPALTQYRVPIQYATYTLNGSIASSYAYPSLSFLLIVPFIWLTHGVQSVIIANVVFLGLQVVALFVMLPRHLRSIAVTITIGLPILFGFTVAGVNDALLVPFLLVVAWRWTDVGRSGCLDTGGALRAICLGLALSVQQLSWFIAPFVIVGIYVLRSRQYGALRAIRLAGGYAAVATTAFLAVNLPFIIWGPSAWTRGVLSPILQHAIPYGQGLIDLPAFFHVGGGNLSYFTFLSFALLCSLMVLYVIHFDRMWRAAFILPSGALFFPTRSLSEYFMTVIGVWIVSVADPGMSPTSTQTSQRRGAAESRARSVRRAATLLCALPVVIMVGLALGTSPPLTMRIRSVVTNGQLQGVWRLTVDVTNRSTVPIRPHFGINYFGQMTSFWYVISGPPVLRPHQHVLYALSAPNIGSMPGITEPFALQAVSERPDTISSAPLYTPQRFSCYLSPSFIDKRVLLGRSVELDVQLRSPLGDQVHKRGVRIALGQLIYGQGALIPAEARINGSAEGATPVVGYTNGLGTVSFKVVDKTLQGGNPVYFQAYVAPSRGYPYGYSEIVSVSWR